MATRILAIDDDPDMLEIISMIFAAKSYDIITSTFGSLADRLSEFKPDLVIIDMHLDYQARSGLDLCYKIKTNHLYRHLPVILISHDVSVAGFAKFCAADAFLEKPFSLNELQTAVDSLLLHAHD